MSVETYAAYVAPLLLLAAGAGIILIGWAFTKPWGGGAQPRRRR